MTREQWKKIIKNECTEAGVYRPFFNSVIDTLSGILEMRDNAQEKYEASGGNTIVKHTNKGGATNIVKNPALVVVMECNAQALAYWRELGLTPRGFQAVQEMAEQPKKGREESRIISIVGNSKWKKA